ncbi:uncharacterized protein PAC_17367 [Phialocephala subalpina]|uniref:HNM1-Choline permease n=1 Tax=Phialocephala subalpina TaxID=576137 RepID=A0A1L7XR88_9HELO|nr:uncharacterized protein PAC_17367 [Phialocephala subalpina]
MQEVDEKMAPKGARAEDISGPDYSIGEVVDHAHSLEKRFSLLSTLGVNTSITCTPLAIGTYLSVVIGVGGSPVFVYAYLVAVTLNLLVCASLAEIASSYPHSSGQIYWTAVLAPKKIARPLSYLVGYLTSAAWFFWCASASLLTAQLTWALVCVCRSAFVVQPWHYYLVYVAVTLLGLLLNWPLVRLYPYFLKGMVYYINAGASFILIVLLVRTHPKQSAHFVFADFVNLTGWSSDGVVFMLGLLPGAVAVNGFDCAAHLTDELPNPSRQVPQVMMGNALLSAVTGFPMILVYMFCNVKPGNLLTPIGGQPVAQVLLDALDSLPLTIISILVFIITLAAATACTLTTFSRVWWSFAREGGVPFSRLIARVNENTKLPVNSLLFCVVAIILMGTIQLGSTTAINAILGASIVCIYSSYAIPIVCLMLDRSTKLSGTHYFNLRRFGPICNTIAIIWMAYEFVWLMFPLYLPVAGTTFNYSVAVFSGVIFVSGINWFFHSKSLYVVPVALADIAQSVSDGEQEC